MTPVSEAESKKKSGLSFGQALPDADRDLLQDQYEHMTSYLGVLTARIGRLFRK